MSFAWQGLGYPSATLRDCLGVALPDHPRHGPKAHLVASVGRMAWTGLDHGLYSLSCARVLVVNAKWPPSRVATSQIKSGGVLLSHEVPLAVPSALKVLASGFGM